VLFVQFVRNEPSPVQVIFSTSTRMTFVPFPSYRSAFDPVSSATDGFSQVPDFTALSGPRSLLKDFSSRTRSSSLLCQHSFTTSCPGTNLRQCPPVAPLLERLRVWVCFLVANQKNDLGATHRSPLPGTVTLIATGLRRRPEHNLPFFQSSSVPGEHNGRPDNLSSLTNRAQTFSAFYLVHHHNIFFSYSSTLQC